MPTLDTTIPAAPLAICRAKRMDKPLAKHEIIMATTVSPAPLTSNTSCWVAGLCQVLPSLATTVMPLVERVPIIYLMLTLLSTSLAASITDVSSFGITRPKDSPNSFTFGVIHVAPSYLDQSAPLGSTMVCT